MQKQQRKDTAASLAVSAPGSTRSGSISGARAVAKRSSKEDYSATDLDEEEPRDVIPDEEGEGDAGKGQGGDFEGWKIAKPKGKIEGLAGEAADLTQMQGMVGGGSGDGLPESINGGPPPLSSRLAHK
jgi:hypothetical protein